MSDEKRYNGWTNYETWVVNLWIGNDEGSYNHWRDQAQQAYDDARDTPSANARLTGVEPFTHEERATFELARMLKDEFEEANPCTEANVWADLMNAALEEVNWQEIAGHMIDECDKTEPAETADDE